jgi:hypothetical protein
MSMLEMQGKSISALTEGMPKPPVAERYSLFSVDIPQDITRQEIDAEQQHKIKIKPIIERIVNELRPIPDIRREENHQIVTQPRQTPQFGLKEQMPGQPSPVPTIQVTIGRIEVKATPAAGPSQKRQTAPKIMGLDDYLRQRNERGRR